MIPAVTSPVTTRAVHRNVRSTLIARMGSVVLQAVRETPVARVRCAGIILRSRASSATTAGSVLIRTGGSSIAHLMLHSAQIRWIACHSAATDAAHSALSKSAKTALWIRESSVTMGSSASSIVLSHAKRTQIAQPPHSVVPTHPVSVAARMAHDAP
jgi:hypothetical protein